jgi:hypothetical protein
VRKCFRRLLELKERVCKREWCLVVEKLKDEMIEQQKGRGRRFAALEPPDKK